MKAGSGLGWFNDRAYRYLAFRAGRLAFIWPEGSSYIRVVPCDETGAPRDIPDADALLIEPLAGTRQQPNAFQEFCRWYLGMEAMIDPGQAQALLDMMSGRPNAYALAPLTTVLERIAE